LAYEINPDAYVAWALALASIGAHLAVDYLLRGDASFLFGFNVDVETFALVGLSVLLVFVRAPPPPLLLPAASALSPFCSLPTGHAPHLFVRFACVLAKAVVARQYVVLVQEERRRRRTLHPHQD
jgi:hypothetical protein